MAYEKKTVQEYIAETDDKTVEGFNDNQENRIKAGFDATEIESGSNENGRYIKFDDGTMICTHAYSLGSIVAAGDGTFENLYRTLPSDWIFPAQFLTAPSVSLYATVDSADTNQRRTICDCRTPKSITVLERIQAYRIGPGGLDLETTCHASAIGRWKQ